MVSTATTYSDMAPAPRVTLDIAVADLPVGSVTALVRRTSKWGTVNVRQARSLVAGGLVLTDYEPPAGVPITYTVETFDASDNSLGDAGLTLSASYTMPVGRVIISDPLAPGNAIMLRAELDFAGELVAGRDVQVFRAGLNTIALAGLRSLLQDVPLAVYTENSDERETLERILSETALIQVRTMPDMRLPGELFITPRGNQAMTPLDARNGGDMDLWSLSGDQVTRPAIGIIVALINYDRFKSYLDTLHSPTPGTYNDAAATWSTYLDAMRNPPPEV